VPVRCGCARDERAQVLHGSKLWFLSPPPDKPEFDGDVTQMQVARATANKALLRERDT
jgi:hypothetical protein